MKGPDIDGYPYAWDGLELVTTQRLVNEIWIRLSPGSTTKLPPQVPPDSESYPSTVLRKDLIAGLDAAGCRHDVNDRLTFAKTVQHPHPTCRRAVFFPPGRDDHTPHRDHHHLSVIHKHRPLTPSTPQEGSANFVNCRQGQPVRTTSRDFADLRRGLMGTSAPLPAQPPGIRADRSRLSSPQRHVIRPSKRESGRAGAGPKPRTKLTCARTPRHRPPSTAPPAIKAHRPNLLFPRPPS
ncbi:hypothetical protein RKD23_007809 [Streptomyces sp. SAI-170]